MHRPVDWPEARCHQAGATLRLVHVSDAQAGKRRYQIRVSARLVPDYSAHRDLSV